MEFPVGEFTRGANKLEFPVGEFAMAKTIYSRWPP
jgi:hypothetical protein